MTTRRFRRSTAPVPRRQLAAALPLVATLAARPASAADPREVFTAAVDRLFAGDPKRSAELFDELVALRPEIEPELWQRGLALYYADRFADGRRQFERHKEVNPADVENVTWHFACVAREQGIAAARKMLLPVGSDARVPMKEVLDLYRGTGSAEAVLAAAAAGPDSARRNQLCYAHLYLGLLAEAEGDDAAAKRHLVAAATTHRMDHFMGKIAQLHCRLRGWEAAQPAAR